MEKNLKKKKKNICMCKGFPDSSVGKESTCNARDPSLIPGSGRSAGEGIGYPLQYSGLENPMDCIVHRVPKNGTQLGCFHYYVCITESLCYIARMDTTLLINYTSI